MVVHILNGDCLLQQFPKEIGGTKIVARECLVDGNVEGTTLKELYQNRIAFLSKHYSTITKEEYFEKTIQEFNAILRIENNSTIYLWFEDDLFCQINFWFVAYLLSLNHKDSKIYLVRSLPHSPYGFGGLSHSELLTAFSIKTEIKDIDLFSNLWIHYQKGDIRALMDQAQKLSESHPFILKSVQAHIDRIPTKESLGRPKESILQIMKDLKTKDFSSVFKAFCERESHYGFGDLQVKRLFDELIS